MRGNPRFWGRQDYVEPAPLSSHAVARIHACAVRPRWPDRPQMHRWHEVLDQGQLLGYVTTRLGGQYYRTPKMDEWFWVADDWNRGDPVHGKAILQLLDHLAQEANSGLCDADRAVASANAAPLP